MGDKEIIDGLRLGDNEAYRMLYTKYYHMLCIYANKIVGESYKAETIVNAIIFSIWKNRLQIDIQNLRGYLLRSVRNRSMNILEEERRRMGLHGSLSDVSPDFLSHSSQNYEYSPLDYLLAKELDVKIVSAIEAMPTKTREIFLLSRSTNLKYQGIALELGVSVDVVKYHMKQALSILRVDLKEYFFKKNNI